MITLELTDEEARTLREILEECVSDLGMEIADTDLMDFRLVLKKRKALLIEVAARLAA